MRILKNVSLFIMLLVLILFVFINLRLSNITINSFTQFTKEYTDNIVISSIFRASIFLDFLMILSIISYYIFDWKNNIRLKRIIRRVIIILNFILLFLIWFEIYFGTTFRHGYERTLFTINNSGLIGSLIFSFLILILLEFEKTKIRNKILVISFFVLVIFIHYLMFLGIKTI